jgi:hypothetical protein
MRRLSRLARQMRFTAGSRVELARGGALLCEHVFVGSKGHPHAHFQHAIELGHLLSAETAARQLDGLSHADALALTLLIKEKAPARFPRAAARWHARVVLDTGGLGLGDSQLVGAALAALPQAEAARMLSKLTRRYRVANIDPVLRRFC